jgi:Glycosyltransferase family 87
MGVLLPVALAAGSRWRSFAAAALIVIGLIAASFVLLGADAWSGFLDQMKIQTRLMELGDDCCDRMKTVFIMLRMFGAGLPAAYAAQACSAVLALLAVAVVWRTRSALELKAATLVVAVFLATPYAQDYDMVVLPFIAAWLARDALAGRGFRAWEKTVLCLLLAQPIMTMLLSHLVGSQVAPLVLWLTLALLLRRALSADVDRSADSVLTGAPA